MIETISLVVAILVPFLVLAATVWFSRVQKDRDKLSENQASEIESLKLEVAAVKQRLEEAKDHRQRLELTIVRHDVQMNTTSASMEKFNEELADIRNNMVRRQDLEDLKEANLLAIENLKETIRDMITNRSRV